MTMTMTSRAPALRARITAIHGGILVALGSIFSVNTLLGGLAGAGMYPFLQANHIGAVGLLQAYLLMALVGTSLLVAYFTSRPFPRAWHWLAIAAHLPPLVAVAIFASSTPEMTLPFVLASLAIHGTGIGAELFALSRRD
jgi:hypothetical protein